VFQEPEGKDVSVICTSPIQITINPGMGFKVHKVVPKASGNPYGLAGTGIVSVLSISAKDTGREVVLIQ